MNDIKKSDSVWFLVEKGLTGTENQLKAVEEALFRLKPDLKTRWKTIERGSWFMPRLETGFFWENDTQKPDLVIAAGSLAILPSLLLKARGVNTVFVQDPRWPWRGVFDRIYAPFHDHVCGPNIVVTDGSPTKIRAFTDAPEENTVAFLVGGPRKGAAIPRNFKIDDPEGRRWLVTFSRRTPDSLKRDIRASLPDATFYDPKDGGQNPYFDFLRRAERILVTNDSASMISDACSTGRHVSIFPLWTAGKRLDRLAAHLSDIGALNSKTPYTLKDADKVANDIAGTFLTR